MLESELLGVGVTARASNNSAGNNARGYKFRILVLSSRLPSFFFVFFVFFPVSSCSLHTQNKHKGLD